MFVVNAPVLVPCHVICSNGYGQIGSSSAINTLVLLPTAVSGNITFTSISAGAVHTCGATAADVKCWGGNANGQLGTGSTTQCVAAPCVLCPCLVTCAGADPARQFKRSPPLQLLSQQARTFHAPQHHPVSAAGARTTSGRSVDRPPLVCTSLLRAATAQPMSAARPRFLQCQRGSSFPAIPLAANEHQHRCYCCRDCPRLCHN